MAAYRYWRLECAANTALGYFSLNEVAMRSAVGGADFWAAGTLSASSTYPDPQYATSKTFDGDRSTWWLSNTSPLPHWIQVDTGAATTLAQLDITTRNDGNYATTLPASLLIRGSNDGAAFTTVHTYTRSEWVQNGTFRIFLPGFAPGIVAGLTRRAWRLEFVGTNAAAVLNAYELRDTVGGANRIGAGALTASSSFDASYLPANTQDADDTTRWVSTINSPQPQALTTDFGGTPLALVEMLVRTATVGNGWGALGLALQLTVLVSADTVTYMPVAHVDFVSADWAAGTSYVFAFPVLGAPPPPVRVRATRTAAALLASDGGAGVDRISRSAAHYLAVDAGMSGPARTTRTAGHYLAADDQGTGLPRVSRSAAHHLATDSAAALARLTRAAAHYLVIDEPIGTGVLRTTRSAAHHLASETAAVALVRTTRGAAHYLIEDDSARPLRATRAAAHILVADAYIRAMSACAPRPLSSVAACAPRPTSLIPAP